MNANRMKYATTPTYGMQKRGLFKRPEPAYKAPETPDFSQATEQPELFGTFPATTQPGYAQPPMRQPSGPYVQSPYFPQNQTIPPMQTFNYQQQGYPPQSYQPQGYPGAQQRPGAYPQQPVQGGYMQPPLGNSAPVINPAQGGYSPHSQGYVPAGAQGAPQMRGTGYAAPQQTRVPLMGGVPLTGVGQQPQGYQPMPAQQPFATYQQQPAAPAQRPPIFNFGAQAQPRGQLPQLHLDAGKLWTILLFGLLPALFIPCLFVPASLDFFRYAFLVLSVVGLGAMWYRQMFAQTTRLIVSIAYVALCVVCIAMMMQGTRDTRQNAAPVSAQTPQTQATEAPLDEQGAAVAPTDAPVEPEPSPSGPSEAEQRLTTFMSLWMSSNTQEMVSFVQPTWASAQDNPSAQLFVVLANRTPENFTIEEVSGTDEDNSRTVSMTASINKNNGKDPETYRFMVLMVKEGGEWYVDPNSLATNDREEEKDENVVNTSETAGLMTLAPRATVSPVPPDNTLLYYNADGGNFYHLDPNCPSIRPEYLPLTASFLYSELSAFRKQNNLQPCLKCNAPTQAADSE